MAKKKKKATKKRKGGSKKKRQQSFYSSNRVTKSILIGMDFVYIKDHQNILVVFNGGTFLLTPRMLQLPYLSYILSHDVNHPEYIEIL